MGWHPPASLLPSSWLVDHCSRAEHPSPCSSSSLQQLDQSPLSSSLCVWRFQSTDFSSHHEGRNAVLRCGPWAGNYLPGRQRCCRASSGQTVQGSSRRAGVHHRLPWSHCHWQFHHQRSPRRERTGHLPGLQVLPRVLCPRTLRCCLHKHHQLPPQAPGTRWQL